MRLDRFFTQFFFHPLKRLTSQVSSLEIPILMYHSIASDIDNGVHPYFRTVTKPETFEMHMNFLKQWGFEVLTLSEAVRLLNGNFCSATMSSEGQGSRNGFPRRVVITFDDGFRDFYTTAFPILEKYGFKATVFLTAGFVDKIFLTGRECLRTNEIKELTKKGIEFGSHTVTHPRLKMLLNDEVVKEISDSKKIIEEIIGSQVTLFSYPYGFPEEDIRFTQNLSKILVEQGYSAGVTTVIGLSSTANLPFFLKRLPVNDCDDGQFLRAKLDGGYDWLHKGQLTYKKLRATFINPLNLTT